MEFIFHSIERKKERKKERKNIRLVSSSWSSLSCVVKIWFAIFPAEYFSIQIVFFDFLQCCGSLKHLIDGILSLLLRAAGRGRCGGPGLTQDRPLLRRARALFVPLRYWQHGTRGGLCGDSLHDAGQTIQTRHHWAFSIPCVSCKNKWINK